MIGFCRDAQFGDVQIGRLYGLLIFKIISRGQYLRIGLPKTNMYSWQVDR